MPPGWGILSRARPLTMQRQVLLVIASLSRWIVLPVAAVGIVTIGACGHAMPRDAVEQRAATEASDPWRVRGSVGAGPIIGTPTDPYGARP